MSARVERGPSRAPRARVAIAMAAAAVLVLTGGWWAVDRSRAWEAPRWREADFVRIDPGPRLAAREVRVVPVNPDCPHCRGHLARARALREHRAGAKLVALVVDQSRRPGDAVFAESGADEVWWDRDRVWRERWGHRVYGETLVFDAAGRCTEIVAARAAEEP